MINHNLIKEKLTTAIIEQLRNLDIDIFINKKDTVDTFIRRWWYTGKRDGLRLTEEGRSSFELVNLEFYDYDIKIDANSYFKIMLDLNKNISCPYYLGTKKKTPYIRFYDSKIAVLVKLYGDVHEYLESLRNYKNVRE